MSSLRRFVPLLAWLPEYRRPDLLADLRAGATVAVLVIPQAMAYAALAGVPPITGLYAAVVSLVVYAVFGTSRYISVGPVAIDSLLTAAAVGPLAAGDPTTYLALASALAVMVGVLQVTAGAVRLGALVNFVSAPVISGFTSAAALTIAATQLKDLLGLDVTAPATTFVAAVRNVGDAISTVDPLTTLLGVAAILALVALRRWAPRVPGPLVVVSVLTLVVWAAGWGDQLSLVGEVPAGLPVPGVPNVGWGDVRTLLPSAAAIALISYMESISTGTAFARRTRTRVDPDQEFIAVGLANTGAGLAHGFPVAGGFSRGAVNFNAGARSPLSGVIASALILVALFTATGLLAHLPKVALAAVIMVAVATLVDVGAAIAMGRVRRGDLVALLVTFVATLVLGPAPGLGVGVLVSVVLLLRHTARPHIPELGRMPGQQVYRNVLRHEVLTSPDLVVLRIDAPLTFASARPIADRVTEVVGSRPAARWLVLDCSAITTADFTGVEMLQNLCTDLEQAGVVVHLAALRGPVRDILERNACFRATERAGRVHTTVAHAVDSLGVTLGPHVEHPA
ncbi:MAG TPA: SulP family inorganic anion transporter [Nocardioides sp.]|uniref:SulP family inorganic anion transporter n=1 Tax=Nocardioides sp. TaxID=35761 RepID=UPI002C812A26|nr:SulP family inorganic anion transporter [Nocardioides sp.]HQR27445.1 SulP family inorganic anion transporter [Nocardioides sp.]